MSYNYNSNVTSEALGFSLNQISIGNRVIKSMTAPFFPANCPLGKSSKLLSLRNNASKVEQSTIQIR